MSNIDTTWLAWIKLETAWRVTVVQKSKLTCLEGNTLITTIENDELVLELCAGPCA